MVSTWLHRQHGRQLCPQSASDCRRGPSLCDSRHLCHVLSRVTRHVMSCHVLLAHPAMLFISAARAPHGLYSARKPPPLTACCFRSITRPATMLFMRSAHAGLITCGALHTTCRRDPAAGGGGDSRSGRHGGEPQRQGQQGGRSGAQRNAQASRLIQEQAVEESSLRLLRSPRRGLG